MPLSSRFTSYLTLNAPIATIVVCLSRLLKCLRSLYGKQCLPRSDCSYRSSLFWVHAVCFYTKFVSNVKQLFAADDFSRRHFQMHFLTWRFRVKPEILKYKTITLCMLCTFHDFFFSSVNFFRNQLKKIYQEYHQSVKYLNPDQARRFVGPDLGPNCLQRFSAEDKIRRWQVKKYKESNRNEPT